MNKNITTIILAVLVIILGGLLVFKTFTNPATTPEDTPPITDEPVFCTMDAKICPDGSSVGRIPPNCEFAACPAGEAETIPANWLNGSNGDVEFRYPENLDTTYIEAVEWPPTLEIMSKDEAGCDEDSTNINGVEYCIAETSEGAAGSTFTDYTYTTAKDNSTTEVLVAKFSLRFPQCANYAEQEAADCETERESFNLTSIIATILQSANVVE